MRSEIETRPATESDIAYVVLGLRPDDRREVEISGVDAMRRAAPEVVAVDGVPAALFGTSIIDGYAWAFFVGTSVVDQHPVTLHRMSVAFVTRTLQSYPDHVLAAQVWTGYAKSIAWLKRLGFVETNKYITTDVMIMEHSGRSHLPA